MQNLENISISIAKHQSIAILITIYQSIAKSQRIVILYNTIDTTTGPTNSVTDTVTMNVSDTITETTN